VLHHRAKVSTGPVALWAIHTVLVSPWSGDNSSGLTTLVLVQTFCKYFSCNSNFLHQTSPLVQVNIPFYKVS
jgi:hypothetical protein